MNPPISVAAGPIEPSAGPSTVGNQAPSSPEADERLLPSGSDGQDADTSIDKDRDADEHAAPTRPPAPMDVNDPYSNLDGAFGGYIADGPRPMQNRGQNNDLDDLLL